MISLFWKTLVMETPRVLSSFSNSYLLPRHASPVEFFSEHVEKTVVVERDPVDRVGGAADFDPRVFVHGRMHLAVYGKQGLLSGGFQPEADQGHGGYDGRPGRREWEPMGFKIMDSRVGTTMGPNEERE